MHDNVLSRMKPVAHALLDANFTVGDTHNVGFDLMGRAEDDEFDGSSKRVPDSRRLVDTETRGYTVLAQTRSLISGTFR